jgi:hypothetical protein
LGIGYLEAIKAEPFCHHGAHSGGRVLSLCFYSDGETTVYKVILDVLGNDLESLSEEAT